MREASRLGSVAWHHRATHPALPCPCSISLPIIDLATQKPGAPCAWQLGSEVERGQRAGHVQLAHGAPAGQGILQAPIVEAVCFCAVVPPATCQPWQDNHRPLCAPARPHDEAAADLPPLSWLPPCSRRHGIHQPANKHDLHAHFLPARGEQRPRLAVVCCGCRCCSCRRGSAGRRFGAAPTSSGHATAEQRRGGQPGGQPWEAAQLGEGRQRRAV